MKNHIPKTVKMYIQYRDGYNFKNGDFYYWSNKKQYTEEQINEAINELILMESVVPYYYNLPQIAAIDNEFITVGNDCDHSFVEVDEPEFMDEEKTSHDYYGDISDVIYMITHKEEVSKRMEEQKQEARKILTAQLKRLK